ncbi:MAG TPA: ThiF family adenylyltransferase [Humisphaera sp.]
MQQDPTLGNGPLVVLVSDGTDLVAIHSPGADDAFARKLVVIHDTAGARSARPPAAADKRVAVVGAGSVGSKVAESLVRSGIRRILLVDGDVFLPGNLERHALDWRDIGFKKVLALRRRLQNIAPGCDVTVVDANLDWQRSPKTHSDQIDRVAACHVVVDATGDTPTSLLLGAVASENGRSFVSAEVYEGGIGAAIGRSVPGRDPPFALGRSAYLSYCEQRNVTPPAAGPRDYEAISSEGAPVVADDAAVSAAAAHAARVALDALDDRVGEGDPAWLLLGFRKAWLFNGHGHNILLDVGGPPPADETIDSDALALGVRLAQEAIDAAKVAG